MSRTAATLPALALVLTATVAGAEVTPKEVWDNWQAMVTGAGQELTIGGLAETAERIEATDVVATLKDDLGGSASVAFDALIFQSNGDGTVTLTMPDSYPIAVVFPETTDGPGSMKLTVSQPGLQIVAGGSATETSYDFSGPSATVTLDELTGQDGQVQDVALTLKMDALAAKYLVSRAGEEISIDTSFSAETLAADLAAKPPEGGDVRIVMSLDGLAGSTKGNLLGAEMMASSVAAFGGGFAVDSAFSFTTMTLDADITEPGTAGPVKIGAKTAGGGLVLAMSKDGMTYGTTLQGADFVISGPDIPFPQVQFGFADYAFNMQLPVMKSDTPQDFAFLTKIIDLTVSDDIWGLFDPAATLSREPASFVLDVKGSGRWTQEILDGQPAIDETAMPAELERLDLSQVLLKAAGAEVSATGGLTFDNTGVAETGAMPLPSGLITVTIRGVNKLVDNLIALGFLTQDDAMGFRMGLAMFARPGAGPDELISEIEFRDGGIFANGQQLQ